MRIGALAQHSHCPLAFLLDSSSAGSLPLIKPFESLLLHIGCLDLNDESLPKVALLRALQDHRPEIHHSDQGSQYAATGYVALLRSVEAQVSMAARGRPTENAYAERLMRTLKKQVNYPRAEDSGAS